MKKFILNQQKLAGILIGLIIVGSFMVGSLFFKNHFISKQLVEKSTYLTKEIKTHLNSDLSFGQIYCNGILSTKCFIDSVLINEVETNKVIASFGSIEIKNINNMSSIVGFASDKFKKGHIDILVNDVKLVRNINPLLFELFDNSNIELNGHFIKHDTETLKELNINGLDIKKKDSNLHIEAFTFFKPIKDKSFFEYFSVKNINIDLTDNSKDKLKITSFMNLFNKKNFKDSNLDYQPDNNLVHIELYKSEDIKVKDFYTNLFKLSKK